MKFEKKYRDFKNFPQSCAWPVRGRKALRAFLFLVFCPGLFFGAGACTQKAENTGEAKENSALADASEQNATTPA